MASLSETKGLGMLAFLWPEDELDEQHLSYDLWSLKVLRVVVTEN